MDFNGDFFQGMESGFFLRDTMDGHREYDCPDPNVDNDSLKKVNSIMGPIRMLLNMVDNDYIKTIFDSLDMIISSTFGLLAIFDGY